MVIETPKGGFIFSTCTERGDTSITRITDRDIISLSKFHTGYAGFYLGYVKHRLCIPPFTLWANLPTFRDGFTAAYTLVIGGSFRLSTIAKSGVYNALIPH
jgi:hypothetical protein